MVSLTIVPVEWTGLQRAAEGASSDGHRKLRRRRLKIARIPASSGPRHGHKRAAKYLQTVYYLVLKGSGFLEWRSGSDWETRIGLQQESSPRGLLPVALHYSSKSPGQNAQSTLAGVCCVRGRPQLVSGPEEAARGEKGGLLVDISASCPTLASYEVFRDELWRTWISARSASHPCPSRVCCARS